MRHTEQELIVLCLCFKFDLRWKLNLLATVSSLSRPGGTLLSIPTRRRLGRGLEWHLQVIDFTPPLQHTCFREEPSHARKGVWCHERSFGTCRGGTLVEHLSCKQIPSMLSEQHPNAINLSMWSSWITRLASSHIVRRRARHLDRYNVNSPWRILHPQKDWKSRARCWTWKFERLIFGDARRCTTCVEGYDVIFVLGRICMCTCTTPYIIIYVHMYVYDPVHKHSSLQMLSDSTEFGSLTIWKTCCLIHPVLMCPTACTKSQGNACCIEISRAL